MALLRGRQRRAPRPKERKSDQVAVRNAHHVLARMEAPRACDEGVHAPHQIGGLLERRGRAGVEIPMPRFQFLPRLAVEAEIKSGKLAEVPVKGMKIEKTLRLVYRREASLSHAAKSFLEIVKEANEIK